MPRSPLDTPRGMPRPYPGVPLTSSGSHFLLRGIPSQGFPLPSAGHPFPGVPLPLDTPSFPWAPLPFSGCALRMPLPWGAPKARSRFQWGDATRSPHPTPRTVLGARQSFWSSPHASLVTPLPTPWGAHGGSQPPLFSSARHGANASLGVSDTSGETWGSSKGKANHRQGGVEMLFVCVGSCILGRLSGEAPRPAVGAAATERQHFGS